MANALPDNAPGCALCGLPMPQGRERFCCDGCLHVSAILETAPAEQIAQVLERARHLGIVAAQGAQGAPPPPAPIDAERLALRAERYRLEGMHCPSCAWLAGVVLEGVPGVQSARVDFLSDSVQVRFDMRQTGPDALAAALEPFGYGLARGEPAALRGLTARFALALFFSLNVMCLSAVHWAALFEWIPPVDRRAIALVQLVLCLPLFALAIGPQIRRALLLLRNGDAGMDLLFALGFMSAFGLSIAGFFTDEAAFYFDACAALAAVGLLGRLIEGKLRENALRELEGLVDVRAAKVAVQDGGGGHRFAPVESVQPGEVIAIDPGGFVPLDGACLSACLVSEAMLTGEPTPVQRAPGDLVPAGAQVIGSAKAALRVLRPYREGRLQQIAVLVASGLAGAEQRLRTADRLARWFIPSVLLLAIGTALFRVLALGLPAGAASVWLPSIAVLLVACPCAFGIAAAAALAVAVQALLRAEVLVREPAALERLALVDLLALDKTGTLTLGLWQVQELCWFETSDPALLRAVSGAEAGLDHPAALAIARHLSEAGVEAARIGRRELLPGRGVKAEVLEGGEVWVGSPALFVAPPALDLDDRTSVVLFGWGRQAAGCFLLADSVRPEAALVARSLREDGIELQVLSGDRPAVVSAVAAALGIERAQGGLTPEEKRDRIAALSGRRVAFAGDGSNDAPAMAAADVALTLRHGTDLSFEASEIVLLGGITKLGVAIRAARLTRRAIRHNFLWTLAYNAVFLPLAALGVLHPVFAAALMLLSSATVLVRSALLGPAIRRI